MTMLDYADLDWWAEDYLMRQELQKALKTKEVADLLEKLAETPPEVEAPPAAPREPVTAYFDDRLGHVRKRMTALTEELETRREVHERFAGELNHQITLAAFSLQQFHYWGVGYNRGVDMKRNFLERQLADFRHKRRQEDLRFWGDMVEVRGKLREAFREYQDAMRQRQLVKEQG